MTDRQRLVVSHIRYASYATVKALIAAGHCERVSERVARTFDVVSCEPTEWVGVSDDDPRLNTVEHVSERVPAAD